LTILAGADFPAFAIPIQGDPSRSTSIPRRRLAAVRAALRERRVAKSEAAASAMTQAVALEIQYLEAPGFFEPMRLAVVD
jgi:hypothetical protein